MQAKMAKNKTRILRIVYIIDDFHPNENEINPFIQISNSICYLLGLKDYECDEGMMTNVVAIKANALMHKLPHDFKEGLDQVKFFARPRTEYSQFEDISKNTLKDISKITGRVSVYNEVGNVRNVVEFIVERNFERLRSDSLWDEIDIYILAPRRQMKIVTDELKNFDDCYKMDTEWSKITFHLEII